VRARRELSAKEVVQVRQAIQRRLGDTSVPTLPQVALRIIELVSNPDSAISDFTEVSQADQALTGRLLRTANSAAFGQRKPVTRIERAMVLMGLDRLKALALGFHLSAAAAKDEDSASHRRVWTQSLFRGWLALRVAERQNRQVAGECFIAGLMSDVGLPMMRKLTHDYYLAAIDPTDPPTKQYLSETMNLPFTHVDVSAALCELWKLPDILQWPISNHHTHPASVNWTDPRSSIHAICCFVGAIPLDPEGRPVQSDVFERMGEKLLGLSAGDLARLIDQAGEDFEACKSMFTHIIDNTLSVEMIVEQANRNVLPDETLEEVEDRPDDSPAPATLAYEVAGLRFEVEPAGPSMVTVYISDERGNRIVSEHVRPDRQPAQEILALLMLDGAASPGADDVIDGIRRLAA